MKRLQSDKLPLKCNWFRILLAIFCISFGSSQAQNLQKNDNSSEKSVEFDSIKWTNTLRSASTTYPTEELKKQKLKLNTEGIDFKSLLAAKMLKESNSPTPDLSNTEITMASANSSGTNLSGSTNSGGQLIVLPSPNASSMALNLQSKTDPYTGKLNLSIPLFTLKARTIDVPISISYSSNGAKVNEIASWVGMGMTLQAGGVISRVMKGLPDEFIGTVKPRGYNLNAVGYLNTKSKVNLSNFDALSISAKKTVAKNANWHVNTNGEAWDTQPDEFYFNFDGHSGKFVFNQDGQILTVPYQNLNITRTVLNNSTTGNIPKIIEFKVVTENGYTYIFGDAAMSSVEESKLEILTLSNNYRYTYFKDINIAQEPDIYFASFYYRIPVINRKNKNGVKDDDYKLNSRLATYSYFTSSWYLKKVIGPNSMDEVTFNYSNAGEIAYMQDKSTSITMPNLSEATLYEGQNDSALQTV